jgi:transposase
VEGILVVPTPEYKTSKTCCRCRGECGRHDAVEMNRANKYGRWKREIRGLRLCKHSECRRPLNRDANAAVNIGTNLMLLLHGLPPIACMSNDDAELTCIEIP